MKFYIETIQLFNLLLPLELNAIPELFTITIVLLYLFFFNNYCWLNNFTKF